MVLGRGHASATVPRICQSSASRQQAVSFQCLGPGPAKLTFCPPGSPFSTCSQEVAQHLVSWDCLVHSPCDFQSQEQAICFCIPGLLKNGSLLPEWIPLDRSGCMALSCQLLLSFSITSHPQLVYFRKDTEFQRYRKALTGQCPRE